MLFKEDQAARAQHQAVRENAGWYLWTHDLVEVTGEDAAGFLDYLFVNHIKKAPVGRSKYTTMLDEQGRIIDDTIVMHMEEGKYWVSTLYAPQLIAWMDKHRGERRAAYRDITQEIRMFAVQGPNSLKLVDKLLEDSAGDLKRFQVKKDRAGHLEVWVHRSGFTGELGYELYCRPEDQEALRGQIAQAASEMGAPELTILEVYVRSLPMEKGFALRQDMYGLTPYACGLDWSVDLEKDFVGREALAQAAGQEPEYRLVGLEFQAESYEDIAQKEIVYCRGVPCGFVRAAIYGYTVEKNIGFAVLKNRRAQPGTQVTVGSNHSPAIVVEKSWL